MPERTDKAVSLYKQTFNCSQAVFTAFRDTEKLDEATALKLATVMGAGVACTGGYLCGAVSGALLAISMKHGRATPEAVADKVKTYEMAKQFMADFKTKFGSCDCEEILGINIGTPEGLKKAGEIRLFETKCLEAVRAAALILEGMMPQ